MLGTRIFAASVAFAACAGIDCLAQEDGRAVVLEVSPLKRGDAFACRIPVSVRYGGAPPLAQISVVAEVLSGGNVLGSTGVATGRRPVVKRREDGLDYEAVPLQFDLTAEFCRRADSLRISFARCVFGELPAEDCIGKMRFAGADEGDNQLFLSLKD